MIFETADAAAGRSTLYDLAVGEVFAGTVAQGADSDWVGVELQAGSTYTFAMVGTGALGARVNNPYLFLRDASGGLLAGGAAGDNAGPGTAASFSFTARASGTYYLDAQAKYHGDTGSYAVSATLGDRASYNVDMGAGALLRGQQSWSASAGTPATLTWSIRAGGVATEDAAGNAVTSQRVSDAQRAAIHDALADYSDVAKLTFHEVAPGGTSWDATVRFGSYSSNIDGAGAFAYMPGSTAPGSVDGDVWLNNTSVSRSRLDPGSYSFNTLIHEIGHAMGLAHPGDYNAAPGVSITYGRNAQFIEDSHQYTVMSYFDGAHTTPGFQDYPDTLMLYDIYAVQQLYGANMATRAGDTTYGFHSTLAGTVYDFATNAHPVLCIWDGGGRDTLDLSGYRQDQTIDLHDGAFSSVGGEVNSLSIAVGAVIEDAIGGGGNDTIVGNAADNALGGRGGSDRLSGGAGNDIAHGDGGGDNLIGGRGDDRLYGDAGSDRLNGQAGADRLAGGSGGDRMYGGIGGDRLSGNRGDDHLIGGGQADHLNGGAGADTLNGGAGHDVLTGGAGADRFVFGTGAGHDSITDFDPTADLLRLDRALAGAGVHAADIVADHATATADGVDLSLDGGVSIHLAGLADADLLRGHIVLFG